jgi:hypothetical protein
VVEPGALSAIRASLKACAPPEEDVETTTLILPLPDQKCEVLVTLPRDFRAGPQSRGALQLIDGVGVVAGSA